MWDLVLPHFFLGLGIGMVDSVSIMIWKIVLKNYYSWNPWFKALMPLLAKLVDDTSKKSSGYGSMYAIAQTAVCLAYGLGPLVGGHLATQFGFPELMRTVGICNLLYSPFLLILAFDFKNSNNVRLLRHNQVVFIMMFILMFSDCKESKWLQPVWRNWNTQTKSIISSLELKIIYVDLLFPSDRRLHVARI